MSPPGWGSLVTGAKERDVRQAASELVNNQAAEAVTFDSFSWRDSNHLRTGKWRVDLLRATARDDHIGGAFPKSSRR